MTGRYLRGWGGEIRDLWQARNAALCLAAICTAVFLGFYHRPHVFLPALAEALGSPAWLAGLAGFCRGNVRVATMAFQATMYLLIPLFTLPLLRRPVNRLGWRLGNVRRWSVDTAIAYLVILVLILVFARGEVFRKTYPLYHPARDNWRLFWWYELFHFSYMLGWEFMFRGYTLFAVEQDLGRRGAVIFQALPFALLHIGKPELESFGSILAGFYLGLLALRAGSFLPCVLLHFGAAFSMDLYALYLNRAAG